MTGELLRDVSRETHERLELFERLVQKWTPKINLVSKADALRIRDRHIIDSVQVAMFGDYTHPWIDLGSGGGFPGIVIGILAAESGSSNCITLVESDQRKATFLRAAIRELQIEATVLSARIEDLKPQGATTVSARALADLDTLLSYAKRHLHPDGVALFPKGARWRDEVKDARKRWTFTVENFSSVTDPSAAILKIKDIEHV